MNNIDVFLQTLPIMAKGWIGIFIVMIVIFILISALNIFTKKSDGADE